jgi:cbb3-type cytochrome oxidase maturation protein
MTGESEGAFIAVWIAFAVVMLLAIVAVLVWAIRSRQFADQDHAARLPLESGIPVEPTQPKI